MKKEAIFMMTVLFFVIAHCKSYAQEKEPALARVFYEFIHVNDTSQPNKHHKEEMVLYIGQNATLFSSYAGERAMEKIREQVEDPGFDGNVTISGPGRSTRESYYFRANERVLKQVYRLPPETYTVEQEFPVLEWTMGEESKEIGGYTVQKATTRFRGRDYSVWFTSELPFQSGPWKFQGLPGLILEVADSKGEVFFKYAGFEKVENEMISFGLPENTISTDQEALDKLVAAVRKNPQAAMSARSGGGSSGGLVTNVGTIQADVSKIKSMTVRKNADLSQTSEVDNNPLELTD